MIFIDTWAWIALADRSDQYFAAATAEYHRLRRDRQILVTSDYVLCETLTHLSSRIGVHSTGRFVERILFATERGAGDRLMQISRACFDEAMELRLKYDDKPGISFTDLTSMAVMQDLGITDIFTGDRHFEQVGLGFHLRPNLP